MSRALLTCSLVLALCSIAVADRAAEPRFSQPPPSSPPHARYPHAVPDSEIMQPPARFDRETLRAALIVQRHANLERFRAYQRKGVFPNNTFSERKLNVWRDNAGDFCAAATMIKMSGFADLVVKVAEQNNFIRLADVSQGPLMDWILTSGLTQDEIVAIQQPFMPVSQPARPSERKPILVDAKRRKAEDERLRAYYRQVESAIVRDEKKSVELAVDRLMKNQALAWRIINTAEG